MKKYLITIAISILFALPCFAHQPYLIQNTPDVINVPDPEISKAYYSELKGQPQYYQIISPVDFALYVNILIPAVPETTRDMLVEVWQGAEQGTRIYTFNGKGYYWQPFFEEFARDDYFKGGEYKENVAAGTYLIKVSSPDNAGRYSLAIGEKEAFPAKEILRSLLVLPQIKSQIFNKPAISAFLNIFGLFIWIPLLIILIIIIVSIWLVRKRKNK